MSNPERKSLATKVQETVTPEDQKSYLDKGKEVITDSIDKIHGNLQPEEEKSTAQRIGDAIQTGHDDAKEAVQDNGKSFSESAGEYAELAKQKLAGAAGYVSGAVTGATEGAKKGTENK